MASKVMVKIPVAPFSQVNKSKTGDLVTVRNISNRNSEEERNCNDSSGRVAQLEQNIRFLQEQHQMMLTGLHNEIESLRNRNRELQFQLVFVKGNVPSTPSSPEDDTKHKVYTSPKQLNITPLQVEILEKELTELKLQMQEIESRNVYLSAIVDEQKKKLERYERDREKERERALQPDPELLRKLDDAEAIIRRLRRENSDLRRENNTYQTNNGYRQQSSRGRRGGNYRGSVGGGGNGSGGGNGGNWFPPLHTQSYWPRGGGGSGNNGERSNNHGGGGGGDITPLPSLNGETQQFRSRGNNNNYDRNYRGGKKNHKPAS